MNSDRGMDDIIKRKNFIKKINSQFNNKFNKWYNYELGDSHRMYSYCEDISNLIKNICCEKKYCIVVDDDKFLEDLIVILFNSSCL